MYIYSNIDTVEKLLPIFEEHTEGDTILIPTLLCKSHCWIFSCVHPNVWTIQENPPILIGSMGSII